MRLPAVLRRVRADDWWLYHLLPLLGVAYASAAVYAVPAVIALPALGRLLASIVLVAAYSHVVNDLGDVEQDARAGKPDRWAGVPVPARAACALLLLAAGFAVWIGSGLGTGPLAVLAGIALLQPLYALPPLRLKERGAWGIVADSLHTHALPTLFCAWLFAGAAGAPLLGAFPLAAAAWSFWVGVRGILYHQRVDEANDRRAGAATFVTERGSEAAGALARRVVFPLELAALAALAAALWGTAPWLVGGFMAYGALMLLLMRLGTWPATLSDPAPADPARYIPLLAFYRAWPAPAFLVLLAVRDARYLPLLVLHTVVFAGPILKLGRDFHFYMRHAVSGLWSGLMRRLPGTGS